MRNEIIPFNFNGNDVRVVKDEQGEPWFVAKDVCGVLGFSRPEDPLRMVDAEDKLLISQKAALCEGLNVGPRGMLVVNESGVYQIIFQSNKPQTRAFKKWVAGTVLPSIRKTGGYIMGEENMSEDELVLRGYEVLMKKVKLLEEKVKEQHDQIESIAPKADMYEALCKSEKGMSLTEAFKVLELPPKIAFGAKINLISSACDNRSSRTPHPMITPVPVSEVQDSVEVGTSDASGAGMGCALHSVGA